MILGVAQVIVNVEDLDEAEAALLRAGYRASFRERGLPSSGSKRPFQLAPRSELDMIHLAPAHDAPAVELTAYHGAPPEGTPAYRLSLFDSAGGSLEPIADELVEGGQEGAVARAELRATNAEASLRFWTEGLDFKQANGEAGLLESPALMPSWRLLLALRPAEGPTPDTAVDAPGCVLVTVLTTSIDSELERLAARPEVRRSAEPWDEHVGGRTIRVAFVEGPSGELVELLQVSDAPKEAAGG